MPIVCFMLFIRVVEVMLLFYSSVERKDRWGGLIKVYKAITRL